MTASLLDLRGLECHLVATVPPDFDWAMSPVLKVDGLSFPKCAFALVVYQLHVKPLEMELE